MLPMTWYRQQGLRIALRVKQLLNNLFAVGAFGIEVAPFGKGYIAVAGTSLCLTWLIG
jgi:hypothetical protein